MVSFAISGLLVLKVNFYLGIQKGKFPHPCLEYFKLKLHSLCENFRVGFELYAGSTFLGLSKALQFACGNASLVMLMVNLSVPVYLNVKIF